MGNFSETGKVNGTCGKMTYKNNDFSLLLVWTTSQMEWNWELLSDID